MMSQVALQAQRAAAASMRFTSPRACDAPPLPQLLKVVEWLYNVPMTERGRSSAECAPPHGIFLYGVRKGQLVPGSREGERADEVRWRRAGRPAPLSRLAACAVGGVWPHGMRSAPHLCCMELLSARPLHPPRQDETRAVVVRIWRDEPPAREGGWEKERFANAAMQHGIDHYRQAAILLRSGQSA